MQQIVLAGIVILLIAGLIIVGVGAAKSGLISFGDSKLDKELAIARANENEAMYRAEKERAYWTGRESIIDANSRALTNALAMISPFYFSWLIIFTVVLAVFCGLGIAHWIVTGRNPLKKRGEKNE